MRVRPDSKVEFGRTRIYVKIAAPDPRHGWKSGAAMGQFFEPFEPAVASLSAMPMRTGDPVAAISRPWIGR